MTRIRHVGVDYLQDELGFQDQIAFAAEWRSRPLREWVMAADDAILRYVFRNLRPRRHLEFGTWQGDGVVRCVEECDATVWTINLLGGESRPDGQWVYAAQTDTPDDSLGWSERLITKDGIWVRTDAHGQVGRQYLEAGWGNRVCQIYCDSREWDTRHYPSGFFDTAFIDGGHAYDIVASDTARSIQLVRAGGLVIWHDFCPLEEVTAACESTRDVVKFISTQTEPFWKAFHTLFWIEPSWLLFGVRAETRV